MAKKMGGLAKAARRKMRKRAAGMEVRRKREFTYRGYTLDELRAMTLQEVIELLPARARRTYIRGLDEQQSIFVGRLRSGGGTETAPSEYVDNVLARKPPVPYRRYNRWVAHKSGYGPARYPTKTARYFKKILEDAVANAEYLGRGEPEAMVIRVINAHKGSPVQGFRRRAYGRSTPSIHDTVNLEIVLEEVK